MKREADFHVRAVWDPDAEVWVATSEDIPGLVTEAESCDALIRKLRVLIPELLDANGVSPNIENHTFQFSTERTENIRLSA